MQRLQYTPAEKNQTDHLPAWKYMLFPEIEGKSLLADVPMMEKIIKKVALFNLKKGS